MKIQTQNMKSEHDKLIQTTQQKDKRIKELEIKQDELQQDLQTKERRIQNLESQHEEPIAEQKVRIIKLLKDNADFKVVSPVCPGYKCKRNDIPLENMFEHMKSCNSIRFNTFNEYQLKLNTEVSVTGNVNDYLVYKLKESRDWFVCQIKIVKEKFVFYIIHPSEEETKDVFFYSLKYLNDGEIIKSGLLRCAPVGISVKDAVHNNFTTNIPDVRETVVKFTVFKA